jgi:hypothetical protein
VAIQPVERQTHQRPAGSRRNPLQLIYGVEIRLVPVAIQIHAVVVEACARERSVAPLFPGQQPAGQGIVDDIRDAKALRHGQIFLLNAARDQVVHGLRDIRRLLSFALHDPQHLHHLPAAVIGAGQVAHLALLHQLIHGLERFLNRHRVIRQVEIIQIQIVGFEPAQAVFDSAENGAARQARHIHAVAHLVADFAGQNEILAAAFQ